MHVGRFEKIKNEKDFDAVKMMRDIREKRHSEYEKDPQLREVRLAAIRKKYSEKLSNHYRKNLSNDN